MARKIKRKTKKNKVKKGDPIKQTKSVRDPLPAMPSRFDSEQMMRFTNIILKGHDFKSFDEVNEYLNKHIAGHTIIEVKAEMDLDDVELAQDYAYRAMDADDIESAIAFTKKALDIDPKCIDAQVMAADLSSLSDKEMIEKLKFILKSAEKRMGCEYIEENKGHFWKVVETRPYMRAQERLISSLVKTNKIEEAIIHCEEMLELNPNDNQGERDTLLSLYLQSNKLHGARKLFEQYPGDHFAIFLWGKILERYLSDDLKSAKKLLKKANKKNPYVLDFITGKETPPEHWPESYALGTIEEAIVCFHYHKLAWEKHPKAIVWLESTTCK